MACQSLRLRSDLRLAAVEVHLAQRAGDQDRLGAAGVGVGEDAAHEVVDDVLLGERQRGAAAVGLVVPLDGLAAERRDDVVHVRGVLGVLGQRDLGRPREQATVVAGHLEAGEGPA